MLRLVASAVFMLRRCGAQAQAVSCPSNLGTPTSSTMISAVSFCELCDVGTVRIEIENPFRNNDDADFSDIVITENLLASGLTYVPGSTRSSGSGVAAPPVVRAGRQRAQRLGPDLDAEQPVRIADAAEQRRRQPRGLAIEFEVRATQVDEEGLVGANRNIEARSRSRRAATSAFA